MTLHLLGPFPPPFGGVALHLVRLLEALKVRGHEVQGISQGGSTEGLTVQAFALSWLLRRTPVHYHTDEGNARWMMVLGLVWMVLRRPYVVTVHSFRHRTLFESRCASLVLRGAYRNARAVIAISDEVAADVKHRLQLPDLHVDLIGSHLPVSQWERAQKPPADIPQAWLDGDVRVLANAGRVVRYNGADLYGLDVLMEAVRGLASVQVLIVVGTIVDRDLMDELQRMADALPNCHVMRSQQTSLIPLVEMSHVVVRPTRTEGGPSLTLAEALELGRCAIGSDAVPRPAGTVLFENANADDLRRRITEVIPTLGDQQPVAVGDDLIENIEAVYARCFSG
jgi:hypothetical protein